MYERLQKFAAELEEYCAELDLIVEPEVHKDDPKFWVIYRRFEKAKVNQEKLFQKFRRAVLRREPLNKIKPLILKMKLSTIEIQTKGEELILYLIKRES